MKKYLFLVLALAACSGEKLVNTDSNLTPTKELNVEAAIVGTPSFQNDANINITLTKAGVSLGHINLISDGADDECEAGHDLEFHSEAAIDLLGEDHAALVQQTIADFAYCNYKIEFVPAEENLAEIPELLNRSVYLLGTWDDGISTGNFEVALTDEIEIARAFQTTHDGAVIDHPLHYHEGEDAKTIRFTLDFSKWFTGVHFTETQVELDAKIIENFKLNLKQEFASQH